MATINFDNKGFTFDGTTATFVSTDATETISKSGYTLSSPSTFTTYTLDNIYQRSSTRNIDVIGNSQESTAGRGVTCEYNIKVVGTPELFEATAQFGADKATAGLASILLQTGDDRNFANPNPIEGINPTELVSNMSSGFQTMFSPELPPIRNLSDIPIVLGKMSAWASTIQLANARQQAAHAAAFAIEQKERKIKRNVEAAKKRFGESFDLSSATTAPPATDQQQGNYSIPKELVHQEFNSSANAMLSNEQNM